MDNFIVHSIKVQTTAEKIAGAVFFSGINENGNDEANENQLFITIRTPNSLKPR